MKIDLKIGCFPAIVLKALSPGETAYVQFHIYPESNEVITKESLDAFAKNIHQVY